MTNQSPYRSADPLGPVVSEHPVAGVQQGIRIVLGIFCLIVAIDSVWLGMWPRFHEINWTAFVVVGIIALVFFWLSWDAFAQYVKARRSRVECHEHGLRIHQHKQHQDIRFDDMASVGGQLWQLAKGMALSGAVIWLDDDRGQRIELPSPVAKANELGEIIRDRTFEKRRIAAIACITNGKDARFGRVALSELLLTVDGETWPRSAIERMSVTGRWFSVKPKGQSERVISTEEITNLDVLLSVFRP